MPIIVDGVVLAMQPWGASQAEVDSLYGTISPAHVWRGYITNVPVPMPAEADSAQFLVTYTWANPVGANGAVWFSSDADLQCGHVVDDAFEYTGPASGADAVLPQELSLSVYPNPAARTASITFALPHPEHVEVDIFDTQGRRIASIVDRAFPAGTHTLTWDGRAAGGATTASGVYLYRLRTAIETRVIRGIKLE